MNDARFLLTLLICPQKKLSTDLMPLIAKALPLAPIHTMQGYPDRRQLADQLRTFAARLCFLEFHAGSNDGFQTLETLHALSPGLPVVALLSSNDPELVLKCLRQGTTDFLIAPVTSEQVDACLARVMRQIQSVNSQDVKPGRIVAVTAAKAAAGATTVAVNLAWQCKKRLGKTLLADLDPLAGTISFLLKLKSSYSFLDVIQRYDHLDADLWTTMVNNCQGVDVLLAPETLVDSSELTSATPVLEYARTHYEALVLDLSTTPGDWTLSAARACDDLLVVATNELPSLHSAQRILGWYKAMGVEPEKIKLVINRYTKGVGLELERIPEALGGHEVFAVIPSDPESVGKSLMEAKPVPPGTAFGKAMAKLAGELLPDEAAAPAAKTPKRQATGLGGLISSMFSKA